MKIETFRYDSADYLDSEDAVAAYSQEIAGDDDPTLVERAVGVVIRAYGLLALAKMTGLSRDVIVDALSGEDPNGAETLRAVLRVTSARPLPHAAE